DALSLRALLLGGLLDPGDPRGPAFRTSDVAFAMGKLRFGLRDLCRASAQLLLEHALAIGLRVERTLSLVELARERLDLCQSRLAHPCLALAPHSWPPEFVGSSLELRRTPFEPVRQDGVEPFALVQVGRPPLDLKLPVLDVAH